MTHHASGGRFVASVLLAALVAGAAVMLVTGGIASGSPSSAQYEYDNPVPTAPPAVTGTPQVGQTLTTSNGTWTSVTPITRYAYAWSRCDTNGGVCTTIAGATASTYTLADADQGATIRSSVTAFTSTGSKQVDSPQTAVVAPRRGGQIDASKVALPNRLIIDKVSYSANPIRARQTPTTMKIHVSDSNANSVGNALVYVLGVPYSRIGTIPEVRTDATGWATLQLQPAKSFPRTGYLTLFVRARVDGQDLLGGTSTRRLVQVTIAAPNGT